MGMWAICSFRLLWIMLLWTFMFKLLCWYPSSFLLGICLGVELLVTCTSMFTSWIPWFTTAGSTSQHPHLHQHLLLSASVITAIPLALLTSSSLMVNATKHLFICLLNSSVPSLEKCLIKIFSPFKKTELSFYFSISIFWIQVPSHPEHLRGHSVISDSLWSHDCSPPGSSVHGLLQARILQWVAIFSSRDLPNPWIKPASPLSFCTAGRFFTAEPPGKPLSDT